MTVDSDHVPSTRVLRRTLTEKIAEVQQVSLHVFLSQLLSSQTPKQLPYTKWACPQ